MDKPFRDCDHRILVGTTSIFIECLLVVVIYATTAVLYSENLNRHENIESIAIHKPRRQGKQANLIRSIFDIIQANTKVYTEEFSFVNCSVFIP